jgi:hypothetical protein
MGTELGATFTGRTLTSMDPTGASRTPTTAGHRGRRLPEPEAPDGLEVISDAIGLPVLANANLAMVADVL